MGFHRPRLARDALPRPSRKRARRRDCENAMNRVKFCDMKAERMPKMSIRLDKKKISIFCKKNHIDFLALFGSILTSDFKETSDVDVLVKFEKDHIPSLFDIGDIESELTAIVGRD